ncbi:hypothetical protein MRX96_019696 [Rhipicephalus microplus]
MRAPTLVLEAMGKPEDISNEVSSAKKIRPVVSSMDAVIEKCEPATDYKFFIWRRIYQPCQYLCAGGFIVFENEDDGTACSTLSVPNGECLNGKRKPKQRKFAALTSTTSGTTDEHANATGEEAHVDEYYSAAP